MGGLRSRKTQFCGDNFTVIRHRLHPPRTVTTAGNIHVRIVIGSLRVAPSNSGPSWTSPCDWEAGKKHRFTSRYTPASCAVMEMCVRRPDQINLLEAQGDHVSGRGIGRSGADNAASTMPTPNLRAEKGGSPPDHLPDRLDKLRSRSTLLLTRPPHRDFLYCS